jgi:hypothetical protein
MAKDTFRKLGIADESLTVAAELDHIKLTLAEQFGSSQVDQMPERLYHYTTAEGLLGILQTRKFWATHMSYLNDSSELTYGASVVAERLKVLSKNYSDLPQWKHYLELAHLNRNAFDEMLEAYAVCFCTDGDLLSQWRGYGLSGGGYSIGLRPTSGNKSLRIEQVSLPTQALFRKVIYGTEQQQELIDMAVVEIAGVVIRYWDKQKGEDARQWLVEKCVSTLRSILVNYLVCLKNPVFKEEAEWRYVLVQLRGTDRGPGTRFRARNGAVVPYVELELFNQPTGTLEISDIYCGPVLHPELSVRAITDMLIAFNYPNVTVHLSSIPIRG